MYGFIIQSLKLSIHLQSKIKITRDILSVLKFCSLEYQEIWLNIGVESGTNDNPINLIYFGLMYVNIIY